MDIYSVKMPDQVDPELRARANRVEQEIKAQGRDLEELAMRATDDDRHLRRERKQAEQTEEQLFGTAVPEGTRADERTFSRIQADAANEESKMRKASIKELLFQSLGASQAD